jgi:hypothetical protein
MPNLEVDRVRFRSKIRRAPSELYTDSGQPNYPVGTCSMKASVFVHASCVPLTAATVAKHAELRHGLVGQSQVPQIDASLLRSIARSLGILIVVFAESNGR